MDRGFLHFQTVAATKALFKMTTKKDMVYLNGQMERYMKESGYMESSTGKGQLKQVTVVREVGNGKMGKGFPGMIKYKIIFSLVLNDKYYFINCFV